MSRTIRGKFGLHAFEETGAKFDLASHKPRKRITPALPQFAVNSEGALDANEALMFLQDALADLREVVAAHVTLNEAERLLMQRTLPEHGTVGYEQPGTFKEDYIAAARKFVDRPFSNSSRTPLEAEIDRELESHGLDALNLIQDLDGQPHSRTDEAVQKLHTFMQTELGEKQPKAVRKQLLNLQERLFELLVSIAPEAPSPYVLRNVLACIDERHYANTQTRVNHSGHEQPKDFHEYLEDPDAWRKTTRENYFGEAILDWDVGQIQPEPKAEASSPTVANS